MDVRNELIDSISYFRDLGFFEQEQLSDEALADKVLVAHMDERGRPFDPEARNADLILAAHDKSRVWWQDTEADVRDENGVYRRVLGEWADISRGAFRPEAITEEWESEEGPIRVSFTVGGTSYTLEPEWDNDWLDLNILSDLNRVVAESGYAFELHEPFDQTAFVVVVTPEEKKRLQSERGWQFAY